MNGDAAAVRQERHQQGLQVLESIRGDSIASLADSSRPISPELGYQTFASAHGDRCSRAALTPRDRQLVTLGKRTSQSGDETEPPGHIPLAPEVGRTPDETVVMILHAAGYCGSPRADNATKVANAVFAERGVAIEAVKSSSTRAD